MWAVFATVSCLSFTIMLLLFKQVSNAGLSSPQLLLWVYIVAGALFFGHLIVTRTFEMPRLSVLAALALCGALSYVGNYFQGKGLAAAPNPGYALAVVNTDVLLLTVASVWFFGSEFSAGKIAGTVLCMIGASLLVL